MDKITESIAFLAKCRLCLERVGVCDLFDKRLDHDVYMCTGVRLAKLEQLPQKICLKCFDIVVNAKTLRQKTCANERLMKSLLCDDDDEDEVDPDLNATVQSQDTPSSSSTTPPKDRHRSTKRRSESYDNSHNNKKLNCIVKTEPNTDLSEAEDEQLTQDLKLSVRKDLFESSNVSSSTKEIKKEKKSPSKCRNKSEPGSEDNKYECEICHKKFTIWKKFYTHQRMHNKNILCPIDACGKRFSTKGDVEKHIRTHTGEKPYVCEICNRGFTQNGTLKAHRETVHSSSEKFIIS